MHRIYKEQNSERILRLQFSQRKHYELAEFYNDLSWVLAIILVILSIIGTKFDLLENVRLLINAILAIGVFMVNKIAISNVKIGAATKEYIDSELFHLDRKDKYCDYSMLEIKESALKMKEKYEKEYNIQISNTGKDKPAGLKDWYTYKTDGKDVHVILKCQEENIWWNGVLNKKFLWGIGLFSLVILSLIIEIIMVNKISLVAIINIILLCVSLFCKTIEDLVQAIKYYTYYIKAKSKIEAFETNMNLRMKDLMLLQNDINKMRSIKFLVPNFIHKIYSKKLHLMLEEVKSM
ncbi:S-4TM family putative pore-forming effector [Clostridium oryzae]|uniref:Uncharacterized protein n=1 Tax=Clostridium oryzae TaxID=1450648 RepID=A0A1V4I726_9CLOT|nr:S-4TM family putative pore-forming effector [Clostridium oryzae]OPJ55704.1 hypothetical protein CLORY_43750 [Clostridium oryzae]